MTATMIVGGVSIAPFHGAEAGPINTSRSNIKSMVAQQEGEVTCINQAEGQGDKAALANTEQTSQAADDINSAADFGIDQSEEADSTQGNTEITVNAEQTNNCPVTAEQTVDVAAEGPVSGTI